MRCYINERAMETKQEMPPRRLDQWLRQRFPALTRRQREEAIEAGLVSLGGGQKLKKGTTLPAQGSIDVSRLVAHLASLRKGSPELAVDVVWEREGVVIVDKPAGMPAHPVSLFDDQTLTSWALARYPEVAAEFSEPLPTIVPHRLDSGTSGLQIVCRRKANFKEWRERFAQHRVQKTYLAWAWGRPDWSSRSVEMFLTHATDDRRKMRVVQEFDSLERPLSSLSEVRVLKVNATLGCFLSEVTCHTGVMHQVRIHLSSLGSPLLGDELYDPDFSRREQRPRYHQLRAKRLEHESFLAEADCKKFSEQFLESSIDIR
jgi:23S rRNA pseudouridine1911/1915/1917 synthase